MHLTESEKPISDVESEDRFDGIAEKPITEEEFSPKSWLTYFCSPIWLENMTNKQITSVLALSSRLVMQRFDDVGRSVHSNRDSLLLEVVKTVLQQSGF